MPKGKGYAPKDKKRDPVVVKGLKDGKITQKQFDKMSDGLLKGIVKKGGNGGKKGKKESREDAGGEDRVTETHIETVGVLAFGAYVRDCACAA